MYTNEIRTPEILRYRLESMKSAQCHVQVRFEPYSDGSGRYLYSVALISYTTNVLEIEFLPNKQIAICPTYGNYSDAYGAHENAVFSNTTARHINRFTREFLGDNYYQAVAGLVKKDIQKFIVEDSEYFYRCAMGRVSWYLNNGKKYYGNY